MEALNPGLRVLIVDPCQENREVLRTALERRGVTILEAPRASEGLRLAADLEPDLIVLDLDAEPTAPEQLPDEFARARGADGVPMILLGSARIKDRCDRSQYMRKPYHYAPLIRKIEALLAKAA